MKLKRAQYHHNPPTETELAWLCGIWEGEGTWQFKKARSKFCKKMNKEYVDKEHMRMSIQMTDEDIMLRVAKIMDGRKITYTDTPKHRELGQKPIWTLHITGKPAILWTELMIPYLGERRKQKIKTIFEQIDTSYETVSA